MVKTELVADDLEREQLGADAVDEDLEVCGVAGVERGGVDGGELLVDGVQPGDLGSGGGGAVVFELGVVLVEAGGGSGGGVEAKVVLEVLPGEEVEGLRGAVGGETLGAGGRGDEGGDGEECEKGPHGRKCKGCRAR
jgi:hypothetical protein